MKIVKAFTDYLSLEKNYSPLTVKAYQKDIESFVDFLTSHHDNIPLVQVNYHQIRTWIVSLVEAEMSNRSINRKVSSLNSMFKYLIKVEDLEVNPLAKHKALKVRKKIQVPFSKAEINTVLTKVNGETCFEGLRNRLIVELFYSTGIRRIELINIKLNDLDISQKTLRVIGKRNKERIIPLIPSVIITLQQYIESRSKLEPILDEVFLLLTKKGTKLYETLVYRLINNYFSQVSSKEKTSPHILRHSFATHLLNEGADLNAVKELLGHSSLSSTQVYTHNNITELTKVYKNAHPRGKKK